MIICIGVLLAITMLLVQRTLRVLHITLHGFEDDPHPTNGCKERPWNGMERVKIAAINDPADEIECNSCEERLYCRQVPEKHYRHIFLLTWKEYKREAG